MTVEDETGFANLVVWAQLFEKYRREILQSRLLMVTGKLQIESQVIHVVVQHCVNLSAWLRDLAVQGDRSTADTVFDKGRNFK